ncbi:hypothetical protein BJH93_08230 [Kocuria polaris]|nr:hypothetical protein [Kocuria polaris]
MAERAWERVGLPIPDVALDRVRVPVEGNPEVTIRLHRPHGAGGALPAVITFFGGAFRQGSNDFASNRWMHAQRAIDANIIVIAVDYAQAPEHRFPTAIEQGLAVLDWTMAHAAEHGIDAARIAVGGQSSGGAIAAGVAQWNLDRHRHPLQLQLLEVPALDLTAGHADFAALREQRIPKFLMMREFRSLARDYLGGTRRAKDPRASPLLRDDLTGLPAAVILAAEHDVLRGDAAAYHVRLREAGVPSSTTIALGQTHDSGGMVGALLAARQWHASAVCALASLHASPIT